MHSPHYTMPLAQPARPSVVTLHDATFFTDPELHSSVKARFFRAWTRTSLRRAALCVVPSQATADELVRVLAARDRRSLHVAHHGVDTERFHPPTAERDGRGPADAVAGRRAVRGLPRRAGAAQERARR